MDFVHGLDTNNGLGPDASHASNKPWKTITKLVGATGFASGDTGYLSPSGPFREVVTVNMTSATAETQIIGDPANAQGFKDSGGVLVASGDVILTAYLTNDTTAPSGTSTLNTNGKDFLTFKNIFIMGGTNGSACIVGTTSHATDIKFINCAFNQGGTNNNLINHTGLADTASNWTFDSCYFGIHTSSASGILITLPTSTVADYDANIQIKNCVFAMSGGSNHINITASGANSFKGGGVDCHNCTFVGGGSSAFRTASANMSTSIPCTIYNSVIIGTSGTAINANAAGQILEDNNRILAVTPRANVTAGAASISDASHAPLYELGFEFISGRQPRPFGMPMVGSPLLGRGATAGGPTVDILARPRPAGGASTSYAWGAYERHDTAVRETSVVDAGSNAIKIVGPGDHDFIIPVDATSTTITVRARYDTNHATTNKPQATILNGEEIGVATETKTMTAAVDTWETISFSSFTPTAKGFVTLRLISRSAAGNGIAYFDTVAGGAQGSQGLDYFRRSEPFPAAVESATGSGGGLIRHPGMAGGLNG